MLVSVAYRLYDQAGTLVDTVSAEEPLRYVHGYAQVIPGLEEGLEGASLGQKRSIGCDPDEGFGDSCDDAVLEVDRNDFPGGDRVTVGDEIMATGPDGVEVAHRVALVTAEVVVVDLNHPLAGQRVRFEAEVCGLRPATDEELDEAQAQVNERIVYEGTTVYGSQSAQDASPVGEELIQLRRKSASNEEDE